MNLDAMKKDKMKQRSFYMDDETYALIERHAERLGTSNGTALRMLVRSALLENPHLPDDYKQVLERVPTLSQRPVDPERLTEVGRKIGEVRREHEATAIILPPDTQETFRVPEKFREKGPRVPRPKHDDDDF